jgi:hypothetical protein
MEAELPVAFTRTEIVSAFLGYLVGFAFIGFCIYVRFFY